MEMLFISTNEKAAPSLQERVLVEKGEERQVLERDTVPILSPLRYPGSKRRLASYIQKTLQLNNLTPSLFIEPFAGGASVALQLLSGNIVEMIGLIDLDPLVAAFWQTLFFDTDWLLEQIVSIDVTLQEWDRWKHAVHLERRERALACLFLNRTSFSGILAPGAGPIGGRQQTSAYHLDCRFPRQTLIKRVQQAAALRDRVAFVWNTTWYEGMERVQRLQYLQHLPQQSMYYLDPTFFEKAKQLYTYYFKDEDHRDLRDHLVTLPFPWILSYDVSDKVNMLYGAERRGSAQVELLYSTPGREGNRAVQEVIISNLACLPTETRLWKSSQEWRK